MQLLTNVAFLAALSHSLDCRSRAVRSHLGVLGLYDALLLANGVAFDAALGTVNWIALVTHSSSPYLLDIVHPAK